MVYESINERERGLGKTKLKHKNRIFRGRLVLLYRDPSNFETALFMNPELWKRAFHVIAVSLTGPSEHVTMCKIVEKVTDENTDYYTSFDMDCIVPRRRR